MKNTKLNRAVVIKQFGGVDQLQVNNFPIPEPNERQVRVKIEAASISTTDTIIRKGMFPPLSQKPPFVLGYDFVGKVDKLGKQVNDVSVGDRVGGISMSGGYATYICIDTDKTFTIPAEIEATEAATLTLFYMAAFQMLTHYKSLRSGDKVLIHAATGSVGNALLQLGKIKGLEMVGTGSKEKHHQITRYGAKAIAYTSPHYSEKLSEAAGEGFDAVFDCTDHRSFNKSIRLLKRKGVLITYGLYTKAIQVEKRTGSYFIQFIGSFLYMLLKLAFWRMFLGKKAAHFYDIAASMKKQPARFQQDLEILHDYCETHKLSPSIYKTYTLEEIANAHLDLLKKDRDGYLVLVNA